MHAKHFTGRRIQYAAFILNGHEQMLVRRRQVMRLTIIKDARTNRTRILILPQKVSVIRIVGHDLFGTLDKHPAIGRQRRTGPFMTIDHGARTRITVPKYSQSIPNPLIGRERGVGNVPILMRPLPGPRQLAPA